MSRQLSKLRRGEQEGAEQDGREPQDKDQPLYQSMLDTSSCSDSSDSDEAEKASLHWNCGQPPSALGDLEFHETSLLRPQERPAQASGPASGMAYWTDTEGPAFNMIIGIIVIANALVIGFETDYGEAAFIPLEHAFCWLFFGEFVMRLRQLGCRYFCDAQRVYDALLVVSGVSFLYLLPLLGVSSTQLSVFCRILRISKVGRVLRLFMLFRELTIILTAFYQAFSTVMWVNVVILILDYVLAVVLTRTIGHHASDWDEDEDTIVRWFGSIGNSIRTLFVIMTLAHWEDIAFTLSRVFPSALVFLSFALYIMLASYTLISLVTGIISDRLIAIQQEDIEHRIRDTEDLRAAEGTKLTSFLCSLDSDGDGHLTLAEIHNSLQHERVLSHLEALDVDLDVVLASWVWKKATDSSEGVEISLLVNAIMQNHGWARACTVFDLGDRISALDRRIDAGFDALTESVRAFKQVQGPSSTLSFSAFNR